MMQAVRPIERSHRFFEVCVVNVLLPVEGE